MLRFGGKSQVAIEDLFPTLDEYTAEFEAENQWWEDIEYSKEEIKKHETTKLEAKEVRDKEIAAAMKNMPKWIAQYKGVPLELPQQIKRVPSIRIKTIDSMKQATDHYVKETLTTEVSWSMYIIIIYECDTSCFEQITVLYGLPICNYKLLCRSQ